MTRSTVEVHLQRVPVKVPSSATRGEQSADFVTRDRKPRKGSPEKEARDRSLNQRSVCERFDGMSETVTMIPKRIAITM